MQLRRMKRVISALLVALLLMSCAAPAASASVAAKVNSSSAKAYRKATTKSKGKKIPKNTSVSILSISGKWARVKCKGATLYIPMQKLTPTSKTRKYAAKTTAMYNSAGKKKGTLSKGAAVYQIGTINGYCCVLKSSGDIGYVKPSALTSKKPAKKQSKKQSKQPEVTRVKKYTVKLSKVDKALMVARSLLGRRYAISDNPPNSFNCSSFVQYCMGKAGYSMKDTAAKQAADGRYAKIRSISKLKKGDILFFNTSGKKGVDHSAMYLGNGKFIEASHNAGKVQINSLTNWYKSHFVGARRPG